MGAETFLVGPNQAGRRDDFLVFGFGRFHQPHVVIGVGDGHAAFARGHGGDLVGIAALGCAREVVDHPFGPLLGAGFAEVFDQRAHQ